MNIFDQIYYLHQHIKSDLAEIEKLKKLAKEIPATDPSKEFSGGAFSAGSRASRLIDKAVDMEQMLMEKIEQKLDLEIQVYSLLDRLDARSALVLRKRYIDRMSARDIARELNLSERRVHDIKAHAVAECERLLAEDTETAKAQAADA